MTEKEVVQRLGPPAETDVLRFISRDSSLVVLRGSSVVTTWSRSMTDREMAALVAPGDTVALKISTWEGRRQWPWQAPRSRTVYFADSTGTWRVTSKKEMRTDIAY